MADIHHYFPIKAPAAKVFAGVSTPAGLDAWWTKNSSGKAAPDSEYILDFGPGYEWRAKITKCVPNKAFEFTMTRSHKDWQGSRVGFELEEKDGLTWVEFYHRGWPEKNRHYRTSCYCWAMYLRILKRNIEHGEVVPYEERLNV